MFPTQCSLRDVMKFCGCYKEKGGESKLHLIPNCAEFLRVVLIQIEH